MCIVIMEKNITFVTDKTLEFFGHLFLKARKDLQTQLSYSLIIQSY